MTKPDASSLPRSLEARIFAAYAGLTPSERRLADVLLRHQMTISDLTAGELAGMAGVSKATAARLFRALGYTSVPAAKHQIRTDQLWGSPRAGLTDPDRAPSSEVSLQHVIESDLVNIRDTAATLSEEALVQITEAIVAARRLWIMGLRSGYGLAHHAAHYFTLVKDDVQVLPAGGASYSHEIASIAPGDVFMIIAFRRRPRLLPVILAEAAASGAITVLITDLSIDERSAAAHHVLRCRCQSPSPFNSFVAAVPIINFLAWSVAAASGEASLARFRRVDSLVSLLDDVATPKLDPRR
ncbi:MurR/RpiR family transcriptional regulator [Bosea sp. RCC_152_1]|jgi:DNA-binding MurR/RpiR family transcriptional regulator|uniref:MurR/RpiR family transcriptional regulator n=1 Tax=Bosea sp. RCC_152_1 TaxID=3239228 RepID=UPI003526B98B